MEDSGSGELGDNILGGVLHEAENRRTLMIGKHIEPMNKGFEVLYLTLHNIYLVGLLWEYEDFVSAHRYFSRLYHTPKFEALDSRTSDMSTLYLKFQCTGRSKTGEPPVGWGSRKTGTVRKVS